jgi:hypothetical protein
MDDATSGPSEGRDGLSRRQVLKRGAVIGGAALWVTPAVQVLAVSESSAEQPSGLGPVHGPGKADPRGPAKGRPFR